MTEKLDRKEEGLLGRDDGVLCSRSPVPRLSQAKVPMLVLPGATTNAIHVILQEGFVK